MVLAVYVGQKVYTLYRYQDEQFEVDGCCLRTDHAGLQGHL